MSAPRRTLWLALLVLYVVWGSTYFAIKVAVDTMPPLLTAGTRFGVAAALLAAFLALRGRSLRVDRSELAGAAVAGLFLLVLGVGLVHVAETRIDSAVAAIIAGTVPLQVIVMRRVAGENVARATRLSTAAGLVGLALVLAPGLEGGSTAVGLAVMVASSVAWSTGSFASARFRQPRDPFVAAVYQMLTGALLLTSAGLALGEGARLDDGALALDSAAAWAYLVVAGSLVGFTAYAWLLRTAPISLVVTHQYVNPLVAIALGMLLLGERPGTAALAGAAIVVAAVFVAVRAESATRPASADAPGTPGDPTASESPPAGPSLPPAPPPAFQTDR